MLLQGVRVFLQGVRVLLHLTLTPRTNELQHAILLGLLLRGCTFGLSYWEVRVRATVTVRVRVRVELRVQVGVKGESSNSSDCARSEDGYGA